MKHFWILVVAFFIGGLSYANAADMIILKDGNTIEAKIMEIHHGEIRYRRADNLNGPMIIIPKDRVLSIRYENGVMEIMGASSSAGQGSGQATEPVSFGGQQLGERTPLQMILNALPAIPIAGNNLKFEFGGNGWAATVNGENFSAGTIELEETQDSTILSLKQTHIWPGAVGKTAGRLASRIPGGAAVGGVLDAAGSIAGAAGAIEAEGPVIVLEYRPGPPPKLSYLRSVNERSSRGSSSYASASGDHPLLAENRFDLDGFNVFAISVGIMPTVWWGPGGGITITAFEGYKPDTFFTPSYFVSGRFKWLDNIFGYAADYSTSNDGSSYQRTVTAVHDGDVGGESLIISAGALFKHRFPKDRFIWNVGASLEFMWVFSARTYDVIFDYTYQQPNGSGGYSTRTGSGSVDYRSMDDFVFLFGVGIQTGFSFRFNPYTSVDLNGLIKFPFGKVDMRPDYYSSNIVGLPATKSHWPLAGGIELALTFWVPYRSRQ
jgi:hypothetical protein